MIAARRRWSPPKRRRVDNQSVESGGQAVAAKADGWAESLSLWAPSSLPHRLARAAQGHGMIGAKDLFLGGAQGQQAGADSAMDGSAKAQPMAALSGSPAMTSPKLPREPRRVPRSTR